jgi:diketogulonate reductase-like aldo/keto reductase
MGLDYVDLMIIDSPKPRAKFLESDSYFEGNREAFKAPEEAYQAGKLRSIGLSNFEKADMDNILFLLCKATGQSDIGPHK